MPQPTLSDVHVDRPLTNVSIAFMQSREGFVADKVFPVVPVAKISDRYFTYDRRDWKRVEVRERAPASESAGSGYRISTDSYAASVRAVHKDIDEQIRSNADDPINLDREATEWVTHQLLLDREVQWASRFFSAGVWGTDVTPSTLWDDDTSTPIEDITAGVIAVARETGFRPNVFVMSPPVWDALKNHPDILDRIKYTQRAIATTDLLAGLLDVERVLVAWGIRDTSAEAAAAEASEFVMGKHALLAFANPSPGLLQPSAGYVFGWTGLLGAGSFAGPRISRIPHPLVRGERIEGEMAYDLKVVAPDLGYFFENPVP